MPHFKYYLPVGANLRFLLNHSFGDLCVVVSLNHYVLLEWGEH